MTITDMARDMLDHGARYREHTATGRPNSARVALDEEAITWEHIVRRLRVVLAAR